MSESPAPAQKRPPIRCLVIQLARLGDTIQSLMALRAAQQLYPEMEIHIIAREKFAHAVKRVPWIKSVITLPTDTLLAPVLSGERSETQALADIARWIAPLVRDSWDFVVNWTFSESSSYLTALLPARVKLGFTRRKDTSFAGADGWSHYIQAVLQGKADQNIHLTDILTTQLLTALQIHVGDPENDGNTPVTSKGFFQLELGERDLGWGWTDLSRKWIAIQLGAAHEAKIWAPEKWARTANLILKRHPECSIVLLGGKDDEERRRAFMEELDPSLHQSRSILSLVGETDFDLWASVVGRCQWILSGDTAAIHLASVLGTRVLNVSVGPVRWVETGPYGNGHYVVTPVNPCAACEGSDTAPVHSCHSDVTPESIYAAWSYAANEWAHRRQLTLEGHFAQLGWAEELANARVLRSRIRATGDGGGVVYEPVVSRSVRLNDWTAMVMGHIARSWYCGWVPPVGQELTRETISPGLIQKLRELGETTELLAKICEEARKTALLLNHRGQSLRSVKVIGIKERSELQESAKRLQELDTLVERLGKTHVPLQSFANMSRVLMHNLQSSKITDLGKESAEAYKQLGDGVAMMREWIKFTLNLAKPVAIRSVPLSVVRKEGEV